MNAERGDHTLCLRVSSMKSIYEYRIGLNVILHLGMSENIILVPDKETKPDQKQRKCFP
jgi:hypothetical protein